MTPRIAYGAFSYDLAHLLGAAVLVLSFALLYQRRITSIIGFYAVQSVLLAVAAAWQGWVQDSTHLYITALIAFAAKGVAIPVALRNIVFRLRIERSVDVALGVFPTMALGVGLATLSILVVLPTTVESQTLTREDLALALSVVMLGLLSMITWRSAITQVIGFMSMENGLILAAVGLPGMPLVVELSVAVLVMVAFVVFGVFFFRIRDQFDSLDVSHLDRVGGTHR
jgi:hydrogenase-4 component E